MFFSKRDSDNLESIAESLRIICSPNSELDAEGFPKELKEDTTGSPNDNVLLNYVRKYSHAWEYNSEGIVICLKCDLPYKAMSIETAKCEGRKVGETLIESVSLEDIYNEEREAQLDAIGKKLDEVEEIPFYLEDMLNEEERSVLG